MKKDTIIQFVGFETNLGLDEFIIQWEQYAKNFSSKNVEVTLHHQAGTKNRFAYISQHVWPETDFQFTFMKGRHSNHFPESHVKVIQAGGYAPLQIECIHDTDTDDVKLMLFINKAETDISVFKALKPYRCLNIYEAYYESSLYTYILEFFVEETQAPELIKQIQLHIVNPQIGTYKECLVLNE